MKFGLEKEFCLWLVPSRDGRVRKVRFSFMRLLCCGLILVGLITGVVLLAGDYTRVQVVRAKQHFDLKKVTLERDELRDSEQRLQNKVADLRSINEKVLQYEQNVRQRVEEITTILDTASTMGLIPPLRRDSAQKDKQNAMGGDIGGAEIDCGDNGERCSAKMSDVSALVSTYEPKVELLEELDTYVDLLNIIPIGSPGNGHVSSYYGYRRSPFTGKRRMHQGIDISLATGSQVVSTAEGLVKSVKRTATYGIVVDIAHTGRVVTRYAHLSKALVKKGERICRGQILGLAGSTGKSTGPHLHYEVRVDGEAINPLRLIQLPGGMSVVP